VGLVLDQLGGIHLEGLQAPVLAAMQLPPARAPPERFQTFGRFGPEPRRAPAFIILVLLAALYWGTGSSSTNASFALAHSYAAGVVLCTRGPHPLILYIRNIIPDGTSIPLPEHLALSGRGYALFTRVRGMGILRSSL
jgi:hypothetical protein